MKKIRIISLITLVLSVFASIDLGINFLYSLPPEINDGIGIHSVILAPFFDTGWTRERFLMIFERSLYVTFIIFVLNAVLAIASWRGEK